MNEVFIVIRLFFVGEEVIFMGEYFKIDVVCICLVFCEFILFIVGG